MAANDSYYYNTSKKPVAVFNKSLIAIAIMAEKEGEEIIIFDSCARPIKAVNKK